MFCVPPVSPLRVLLAFACCACFWPVLLAAQMRADAPVITAKKRAKTPQADEEPSNEKQRKKTVEKRRKLLSKKLPA